MTRRKLSDVLRQEVTKEAGEDAVQTKDAEGSAPSTVSTRSRKTTGTDVTADQSSQVQELKAALLQGAEQEKELQGKIKALQAEVKQNHQQIESLETQAAQVAQLKIELAEAKEVILQLSEANTQMSSTLDQLKPPLKSQVKPQPQPHRSKTLAPLESIPYHSVQHGSSTTSKPKSVDVGWMD